MNHEGYPVFKGLQKPLEFMGIRGRFLTLAAGAIGVSFVGFIGFSIVLGKLAGFIAMLVMGEHHNLKGLFDVNKLYLLGGVLGLVITVTVMIGIKDLSPTIAISTILISQLLVAALIDASACWALRAS